MQLNKLHTALILTLCMLLTACRDNDDVLVDPSTGSGSDFGKTPIELSVGGVDTPSSAITRAVITDGTGKTLNAFDVNTKIFMVMKSEYDENNVDFAGVHTTKYNVARGDVNITNNDTQNNRSKIEFDSKNQRYWDDAHARSSQLSIWAYAQMGQNDKTCFFNSTSYDTDGTSQPFAWTTTEIVPTIVTWRAGSESDAAQDQTSVQAQDLLFSNNLANYDTDVEHPDPSKDKRLKFNFSTRKFPQEGEANMIFYHAMSKITIKIIEGEGFDKTSDNKAEDFKFTTTGGNIILKQFNHTGTFDIKQGEFTTIAAGGTTDIPSISLSSTNIAATGENPHYVLEALAVPSIANNGASRFVDEKKSLDDDVMMEFAIDHNKYQITHDDLYEALKNKTNATMMSDNGNYIPLEAGKNYVFTFTVGKTKIKNITAQVAPWEFVEADNITPTNARITLNLEERDNDLEPTDRFSFYRAAKDNTGAIDDDYTTYDWKTGYNTAGVTPTYVSTSPAHWTTDWFWDSNLNFYHFRALAKDNGSAKIVVPNNVVSDTDNGDYYALSSGATYEDILWGAPMLDVANNDASDAATLKWKYGPETNGFDANDDGNVSEGLPSGTNHQIYKAIGPTEDPVKLILFHMMSDLTINIKTSESTAADKVELCHDNGDGADPRYTRTRVDLVGFYNGGKVLLGSGLVKTTDDASTTASPVNIPFSSATNNTQYVQQVYKFGAVPQNLATTANNNSGVQLYITTPDNNQYIVDLKDVLAASTTSTNNIANPYSTVGGTGANKDKYIIDRWYPGFKYTYSFTLAKTGITNLEATIVNWENVEADNETVQIK